jgi:hypothetical protein
MLTQTFLSGEVNVETKIANNSKLVCIDVLPDNPPQDAKKKYDEYYNKNPKLSTEKNSYKQWMQEAASKIEGCDILKNDWTWIAALIFCESRFNPNAISDANAKGLGQFIKGSWKSYGEGSFDREVFDPQKNIEAIPKFFNAQINNLRKPNKYQNENDIDFFYRLIASYNCGADGASKGKANDGFWKIWSNLPKQTRGYVPAIMAIHRLYREKPNSYNIEPPTTAQSYNCSVQTISTPQPQTSSNTPPVRIPGTQNGRDIGGWTGVGNKTVKFYRVYRGEGGIQKRIWKSLNIGAVISLTESKWQIDKDESLLHCNLGNYHNTQNRTGEAVSFLIQQLQSGKNIYVHCDAGCDRTGVFIEALLQSLGVSKAQADADYRAGTGSYHRNGSLWNHNNIYKDYFKPYESTLQNLLLEENKNNIVTPPNGTSTLTKILQAAQKNTLNIESTTYCLRNSNRDGGCSGYNECPSRKCTRGPETWYNAGGVNIMHSWWKTDVLTTYNNTYLKSKGMIPVWHGTAQEFQSLFNNKKIINDSNGKNIIRPGDIGTLYTTQIGHQHGMMWTGDWWKSDFVQNNGWCYGGHPNGNGTTYSAVLWRHQKLWNDSITEWMDMN